MISQGLINAGVKLGAGLRWSDANLVPQLRGRLAELHPSMLQQVSTGTRSEVELWNTIDERVGLKETFEAATDAAQRTSINVRALRLDEAITRIQAKVDAGKHALQSFDRNAARIDAVAAVHKTMSPLPVGVVHPDILDAIRQLGIRPS